jgi:hypothetical protein
MYMYLYDKPTAKRATRAIVQAGQDNFWEAMGPEVALL